jgi:hypothetical protein
MFEDLCEGKCGFDIPHEEWFFENIADTWNVKWCSLTTTNVSEERNPSNDINAPVTGAVSKKQLSFCLPPSE